MTGKAFLFRRCWADWFRRATTASACRTWTCGWGATASTTPTTWAATWHSARATRWGGSPWKTWTGSCGYLWLETDRAYKSALEAISRKRAALKNVAVSEQIDDFAKAEQ